MHEQVVEAMRRQLAAKRDYYGLQAIAVWCIAYWPAEFTDGGDEVFRFARLVAHTTAYAAVEVLITAAVDMIALSEPQDTDEQRMAYWAARGRISAFLDMRDHP